MRHVAPKIYHMQPLVAGPLRGWAEQFSRIRRLGFDWVCLAPPFLPGETGDIFLPADWEALHPALQWDGTADAGLAFAAAEARRFGLRTMLDVRLDRVARSSDLRRQHAGWYQDGLVEGSPDPRRTPRRRDASYARFDQTDVADGLGAWWSSRLARMVGAGLSGLRCLAPTRVPATVWRRLFGDLRQLDDTTLFLAWTAGLERAAIPALEGIGFDRVTPLVPGCHRVDGRFVEEADALRRVAPLIGSPEASFEDRLVRQLPPGADVTSACRQALQVATAVGSGLFMPMGFEFATRVAFDASRAAPRDLVRAREEAGADLAEDVAQAVALADRLGEMAVDGAMRALTAPGSPNTGFLRANAPDVRDASVAAVVLINRTSRVVDGGPLQGSVLPPQAGAAFGTPTALDCRVDLSAPLAPGEVRVIAYHRPQDVVQPRPGLNATAFAASRVAIEAVSPTVPDGDFPVKTIVGSPLTVAADIFAEGHDLLSAVLLWRAADENDWRTEPFHPIGNDRWEASFTPVRLGGHLYTVEAWWDGWATYRHDLQVKHRAGQDVGLEIAEGRKLIDAAYADTRAGDGEAIRALRDRLTNADEAARIALLLAPETLALMQAADRRTFLASLPAPVRVQVDRPQANFASWYELFPRSITADPGRHGTFRDVIARLPAIREMGFDVLYFPPVHPIGWTNRKGRNNALKATDSDVGSPYAIGNEDGGHDALHPQLGTLADFRTLVAAARQNGLEIALDFAIQCSPDHPWLKQHPDWFRWRPDGSLRYAENPPKKYEDIVNPDFFAPASIPSLWVALRDVVRFWIEQGVRIFRVDNPHTKPLPFWRWMIADIQATHPGIIFLAEAFTRPKVMYRLAKVGFTQSYTYFTWRNTKQELTEYMMELNASPARDCFRPNFFVNTPDINPVFLQQSGRAGFLIRAALATTLSGLWGIYSGFELCEAAPLPGREEYVDAEKYEIRVRDYQAPGNIIAEITALNRIRRTQPALQSHLGLTFYNADNNEVLLYGKQRRSDREIVLMAVSLDPRGPQEATIEIPLWELGLPDDAAVSVRDLMHDTDFTWYGKYQRVRLDPAGLPFAVWQITPAGSGA
ncbi:MAG: alpha-1,4-glucan--maltose-1-phosphate maltosyltransferase [Acetobacteraceae bacterium]|nr:alpha-1,4-glucan--maltose-1-phosphate maltosyltransferase [Acetobacteraceae bacterium]